MKRTDTKQIFIGGLPLGGGAALSVQSMCSTKTDDVEATLRQINELKEAGCDIVRLAIPDENAAKALKEIRKSCSMPLVADIHFDYRLAIAAVDAGIDKIRINPGNIGGREKLKLVADACRANRVPIRIGVNSGSLEKDLTKKYGPTPQALCESAMRHIYMLEDANFDDICISIKSSDVSDCVAAYRLISERTNYPLHLGVTETGMLYMGIIKSAAGIGSLLLDGIGDTIRVSLTAEPVEEVKAGIAILRAVGLRRDCVQIISCPTCGRTGIDLMGTAAEVEELLRDVRTPITVAVMGCVVNGPGEAAHADYGLAGGKGEALLFKKGVIVCKVAEENMARALADLIKEDCKGG